MRLEAGAEVGRLTEEVFVDDEFLVFVAGVDAGGSLAVSGVLVLRFEWGRMDLLEDFGLPLGDLGERIVSVVSSGVGSQDSHG